ncbi:MAG: hypothetical protein HYR96_01095 [Deltaproteobacteria bacterium]|nr:hypothetical protein [Deltaproteobacteria bacterium]MBI3296068.1 hypothetical protein [Deltaproteobacteria bacterium]
MSPTLISDADNEPEYRDEIAQQINFLIGSLNSLGAVADLGHALVTIDRVERVGGRYRLSYTAKVLIAWPRSRPIPHTIGVLMPEGGDETALVSFFKKFSPNCSHDAKDPALDRYSFYYYFRPNKATCPLLQETTTPAIQPTLSAKISLKNTTNKSPQYKKVWEDNELRGTLVFATNEPGSLSPGDAGIQAFNQMFGYLIQTWGLPSSSSVPLTQYPAPHYDSVELTFRNGPRSANIALLLIDKKGLQHPTEKFRQRYHERSERSDYISYSGHSDYGENIRALAKMGRFKKGQYQLFFINGCDTFAYVDDQLRAAHLAINPGAAPYEFFNIITNAMPASFSALARDNMVVLDALVRANQTYRQILAGLDPAQAANVMGEEDNPDWYKKQLRSHP